jgi:hypothetical protein
MIQKTKDIGGSDIIVRCDAKLGVQADWLLQKLSELHARSPLRAGARVEIGWSLIILKPHGSALLAHEPDFSRNPFLNIRPDVSATLAVIAEQNDLAKFLGVTQTPVHFYQKVVIADHVFELESIFISRDTDASEDDSGWYIGDSSGVSEGPELGVFVYELLTLRPELMKSLTLPVGYLVKYVGDKIAAIFDQENCDVWATLDHRN